MRVKIHRQRNIGDDSPYQFRQEIIGYFRKISQGQINEKYNMLLTIYLFFGNLLPLQISFLMSLLFYINCLNLPKLTDI